MASNKHSLKLAAVDEASVGLAAAGSHNGWDVAVDEATEGADRWFLQLEGPAIYLYFEVQSPRVIETMLNFLKPRANGAGDPRRELAPGSTEIVLSQCSGESVTLLRDDEFDDRYFILAETACGFVARITVANGDSDSLAEALRQASKNLDASA